MEFVRFLRVLRQRWRLLGSLVLLGVVAGFVSASVSAEVDPIPVEITRYRATHTLIVNTNLPNEVDVVDVRNLEQIAQRLTQGGVPSTVAAQLGVDDVDLANRTSVVVATNSQSLQVTAIAETATAAEDHVNTLALALLSYLDDQANIILEQDLEAIRSRIEAANEDLSEVRSQLQVDGTNDDLLAEEISLASSLGREQTLLSRAIAQGPPVVPLETLESGTANKISDQAYQAALRAGAAGRNILTTPGASIFGDESARRASGLPIPTSPLGRAVLGGMVGLMIAMAITLLLDRMDPRLRTKMDVEEVLDLPVIAEIPPLNRKQQRETEVLAFTAPRSRSAEAYRVLRSSLEFARTMKRAEDGAEGDSKRAHVVLITSPGPSEGKTTTVANAAVVLAEADKEVLVVNCDFRRPRLTDYLGGDDKAQRVNLTSVPGVHLITHVLPEGEHTPADVLAAQRRVIERARDRFDVILLDTAPLLTTNDATDILESADQVVLVASTNRTTRESADRAVELLERRNAPVLGVVLVGARDVPNAREYYYDGDDPYLTKGSQRRTNAKRNREAEEPSRARPAQRPEDIEALNDMPPPAHRETAPDGVAPTRVRQPVAASTARARDRRPPLQVRTVTPVRQNRTTPSARPEQTQ